MILSVTTRLILSICAGAAVWFTLKVLEKDGYTPRQLPAAQVLVLAVVGVVNLLTIAMGGF